MLQIFSLLRKLRMAGRPPAECRSSDSGIVVPAVRCHRPQHSRGAAGRRGHRELHCREPHGPGPGCCHPHSPATAQLRAPLTAQPQQDPSAAPPAVSNLLSCKKVFFLGLGSTVLVGDGCEKVVSKYLKKSGICPASLKHPAIPFPPVCIGNILSSKSSCEHWNQFLTSGIPQHTAQVWVALCDHFYFHIFLQPPYSNQVFSFVNLFVVLLFKYLCKNGDCGILVEKENCCMKLLCVGLIEGSCCPLLPWKGLKNEVLVSAPVKKEDLLTGK